MCFSAEASFAASAALVPAGVYCARTACVKNRTYLLLAAVPFAFSAQQFCEGLVWLGLGRDDGSLIRTASVVYLFFAIAFWPLWIPLSLLCAETRKERRLLLAAFTVLGLAWTWLYWPILWDPSRWLATETVHHSIHYDYPQLPGFDLAPRMAWRVGYVLVISIPLVVAFSGEQRRAGSALWSILSGLALAASFLVSAYAFWYAFTSVWCFFAAILALFLCYVFYQLPVRSPPGQTTSKQEVAVSVAQ
jgi:hypothetical protein